MGDDVIKKAVKVSNYNVDPSKINKTLIVLIPKVKKPNFRPISLCNVIFKVITEAFANRMKIVLPSLIGESQSTFVSDKLITNNNIIAFECFHDMKQKKKGTKGIMALKLHVLKHYDRVEWDFISTMLQNIVFDRHEDLNDRPKRRTKPPPNLKDYF